YPYFKEGKFGQAVLVEEGTENLLPSASAPAPEEMSLSPSDEYYLTTIGGSATIEHKKVEEINRTLDKEGQDFSEINDDWNGGTHTNTAEVDGNLQLQYVGTPYRHAWDEKEKWEAEGNIFDNAIADDDGRLVINQPISFTIEDDMSDYSATLWQAYGDQSLIYQEPNKVRIETQTAPPQESGIVRYHGVNFTQATIVFTVKSQYTAGSPSFYVTNGSKGYHFTIPNTSAQKPIIPFYIRIISDTEVEFYGGITKIPSSYYTIYDTTASPQFRFFVNNPDTGVLEIEQFYFVDELVDIPPMSGTSYRTGRWRTPFIDLSDVGTIESAFAEWEVGYTGDIPSFVYSDILYQLRIDGVEQGWKILHEGYGTGAFSVDIPDLPKGTDASSIEIRLQAELHSFDPVWQTYLNYLRMA